MRNIPWLQGLVHPAWLLGLAGLVAAAPLSAANLELKRVLLSSGGVGYFEYETQVRDGAELTLDVPLSQVDDILKSLVVYDSQGNVGGVTLPGKESLDRLFQDLPFSAGAFGSAVELLNSLQGAGVEIRGQAALQGRLVKVTPETQLLPNHQGSTTRHRVTVLTDQGLRQTLLEDAEALRFTDPGLGDQLNQALAAINEHRAKDRRTLRLQVNGQGERTVRAGYVVEAPLWKASYRLSLAANPNPVQPAPSRLQGWALLENLSGQDWNGVELTLTSGSPVTFRQALYQAYFVKRPEVPVEVLGRILPRLDRGSLAMAPPPPPAPASAPAAGALQPMAPARKVGESQESPDRSFKKSTVDTGAADSGEFSQGGEFGQEGMEQVVFSLPAPVSVKKGFALLLPIIDRDLPTLRVSLYQPATQQQHPLASVQLVNDSPTSLPPGVMTLYERGQYLGDGRLAAFPAGDKRLISFAVDTKVRVLMDQQDTRSVSKGKIQNGVMELTYSLQASTRYQLKSLHGEDRLLWLEHPKGDGMELIAPKDPGIEVTEDFYRLPRVLPKGTGQDLTLVLQSVARQDLRLGHLTDEQIVAYASDAELTEPLRQLFSTLGKARLEIAGLGKDIKQLEEERAALFKDQERLRENLTKAPANSDLAKRYIKKLEEEETSLEGIQSQQRDKRKQLEQKQKELAQYLQDLVL